MGSTSFSKRRKQPEGDNWSEANGEETTNKFRFVPPREPGFSGNLGGNSSPLQYIQLFLTTAILQELINNINDFAKEKINKARPLPSKSHLRDWTDVTIMEINKYFAVTTAMGIDKRPSIMDYWSTYPPLFTPWYHQMFTRRRFEAIHSTMLHCSRTEAQAKEKVEPFIKSLVRKFQESFYPFRNLSIDEMVVGWKRRFRHRQYNPSKPSKFHIKTYGLCDSLTGYVYNLLPYFVRDTSFNPNISPQLIT